MVVVDNGNFGLCYNRGDGGLRRADTNRLARVGPILGAKSRAVNEIEAPN